MNDKQYTQEMIKNINNRLKTKQEALTFDDTPTEGSVNPVTSEGVKAYIDSSKGTTYTAGENIAISENNVISATDTTYTAGDNITIVNNVISSTTDVSGTDDGTNWTSLTINSETKAIPQGVEIVDGYTNNWVEKTWTGLTSFIGGEVWTDGENIYYSYDFEQYILDKTTSTWTTKTWTGIIDLATGFYGRNVWTDGNNIYYSVGSKQKVLDKSTSTWSTKTWTGLISFDGQYTWTDGNNIYYSNGSRQYVLDKSTSTWSAKTWTGLTSFDGQYTWTDGNNIYYSNLANKYVLDKATSTWSRKTWAGNYFPIYGSNVWTDGENIYYSEGSSTQYVLDKATLTWTQKTWTGLASFGGNNIWMDGENIYYSKSSSQYQLNFNYTSIDVLAKVSETGDYSDLKNKPVVNPVLEGNEEKLTGLEVENVKYKVPVVKIAGEPDTDADVLAKVSETGDYNDLKNRPLIPEEKTIYTYSISINKGADTVTLINVQTSEALSNNLTFGDLINNIHLNTLAAEGDYTTMQGSFGFIDSKSDTQFTVSFANGNSYTFASTDTLTITIHLEQSRIFYSRN